MTNYNDCIIFLLAKAYQKAHGHFRNRMFTYGLTPIQYLMLFMEFGIGVADRTAATPRDVNNTTWADGTAT